MKYVCGIDIGSSKIAGSLGCFRRGELVDLWWDSVEAVGVKRGFLQDAQAFTGSLDKLLKNLQKKSGVKIKSATLGIASQNIVAKHSQAVIALAEKGNRAVNKTDIQRVNHQAQILVSCLEEEILHSIPMSYAVDNEHEVLNALGLYGHKLKVNLFLITAKVSYVNTMIDITNRLGIKLNNITLSGLAVSHAVFNHRKFEGISILCDIGKDITQVFLFKDAKLMHYQIVNLGGDDFTTDLSKELNLPYSLAEEVKISYGHIQNNWEDLEINSALCSHSKDFTGGSGENQQPEGKIKDKEIVVKRGSEYLKLSQNLISQTLSKTSMNIAKTIRDLIRPHIVAISSPLCPDRVKLYVSGRTACLDGFLEMLEVVIGLPVKMVKIEGSVLGVPLMRSSLLSAEGVLNYLASFGLIVHIEGSSNKQRFPQRHFRNFLTFLPEKIKEVYQDYF